MEKLMIWLAIIRYDCYLGGFTCLFLLYNCALMMMLKISVQSFN